MADNFQSQAQQSGLADQIRSTLYEDVPQSESGEEGSVPRGAGLLQIPGNAYLNAKDIGQGLAAGASLAGARTLESLPNFSGGSFHMGQAPMRPSDSQDLFNTGRAIVNSYVDNYFKPAAEGRWGDIYRHAATQPLDFASDAMILNPAAKALKLSEGANALAKASGLTRAGEAINTGARGLFGRAIDAASANSVVGPAVESVKGRLLEETLKNQRIEAMSKDLTRDMAYLRQAHSKVPAAERQNLQGYLEGWHPEVLANGYKNLHPAVMDYMNLARKVTDTDAGLLHELGAVTAEQIHTDRYRPMIRQWLKHVYGIHKNVDIDNLSDKQLGKLIQGVRQYADSKGIHPVYQRRITQKRAEKLARSPYEPADFLTRFMAQRARNIKDGKAGEEIGPRLSLEMKRAAADRRDYFSKDSLAVTVAGHIETLQAYHTYKTLLNNILKYAHDAASMHPEELAALKADPGMVVFNPKDYFGHLMKATMGFTTREAHTAISEIFPGEVYMPRSVVKALNTVTQWKTGSLEKILKGFANFARRYVLGFNILWPEKQLVQNLVMLGMTQFTGPKDSLLSLSAYMLARDERIRELIPPHILQESFSAEAGTPVAARGLVGKAAARVEKFVDYTFHRGQQYDLYTRVAAAVHYTIKLSETLPEYGKLTTGMIRSYEAIDRMKAVFEHEGLTNAVAKDVLNVLGDYSSLTASKRAGLRSMLLWWMWYEHIVKFSATLPSRNPIKASLALALARVTPELYQAEMPDGPLKKSGLVQLHDMENDQGIPLYTGAGSMNPWTTLTELAEMGGQPVEGNESSTVLGASNPLFTIIAAEWFKRNPGTGKDFRDPGMVAMGGEQYEPSELLAGRLHSKAPAPNLIEYVARTFAPQPVRFAERVYSKLATGGEPSQFTALAEGRPAPRTVYGSGGEPLEAPSIPDIIKEGLLGQKTFPIDAEAAQEMKGFDSLKLKKAIRALYLQIGQPEGQ